MMSLSFTFTRVTMVTRLRFYNINVQMNLNSCRSFIKEQDSICDCIHFFGNIFENTY